tara:strand:+ start:490 stop:1278 length:789 start_codon:yes stop_codon:yes gene_type:complete
MFKENKMNKLPLDVVEARMVYETRDYKAFSFITGNRNINNSHLEKLRKSMMEMLIPIPIVVNEKLQIIDGQHRYMICKEEGWTLTFIQIKGLALTHVQKINELMKVWTAEAFMHCYCDLALETEDGEYDDYVEYREFKRKYGFGHNETQAILANQRMFSGNLSDRFRNGSFKINDLKKATHVAERITDVGKYYQGYKRRGFVIAMLHCFATPEYDHDRFLSKLSYQTYKLSDQSNYKQYLQIAQDIYNYHAREGDRLLLVSP